MKSKILFKAIGLGLLVGVIVYFLMKLLGMESNSTIVGAVTGAIVAAIMTTKKNNPKNG